MRGRVLEEAVKRRAMARPGRALWAMPRSWGFILSAMGGCWMVLSRNDKLPWVLFEAQLCGEGIAEATEWTREAVRSCPGQGWC